MKKLFIISLLSVFLSACSSAPAPQVNYYLLNTPIANNLVTATAKNAIKVTLHDIRWPHYLKRQSLVMLVGENKINFSHYHLWAESLAQGFAKSLKQEFSQQSAIALVENRDNTTLDLTIEIAHFYPTDNAQVVLSGRYWLATPVNVNKNVYQQQPIAFSFQQALTANGYAQSVKQMRALITLLAAKITDDINR
jgi:uncharacterized protein